MLAYDHNAVVEPFEVDHFLGLSQFIFIVLTLDLELVTNGDGAIISKRKDLVEFVRKY